MDRAIRDDALSSMTRRQLETLRAQVDKMLLACTVCGTEGAVAYRVVGKHSGSHSASLMLCKPCFEKHRLPEGRAGRAEDSTD